MLDACILRPGMTRSSHAETVPKLAADRWYVLAVLTCVYALNIADRFSISTVIEPIRLELHLSDGGIAFLTGVALALFYVTVGIPIAVYADPFLAGANAGALALLGAWAAPDLRALRNGQYYEGDLLGAAAFAALLLAVPFVRPEASWLAGVVGVLLGLLVGSGLTGLAAREG